LVADGESERSDLRFSYSGVADRGNEMDSPTGKDFLIEVMLPIVDGAAAGELVEVASYAETSGLDGVTCGEVLGTEVFSLLGAVAATTERIRIDCSAVSILSRTPTLLAMGAATVASLSRGRFALGLGAGSGVIAASHGVPFERPVERMAATLNFVRRALSGERLQEVGGFRLTGVEPADVRIWLAAVNPKMLRLAGRDADGVVLNFAGPQQVEAMTAIARAARDESGRPESTFDVYTTLWVHPSDDPEPARQQFRAQVAPYMLLPTYRQAFVRLIGDGAVNAVSSAWQRGGHQEAVQRVPDSLFDELSLTGSAELIASRLAEFQRVGCRGVHIITRNDRAKTNSTLAAIELLSDVKRRWKELVSPR
jgi:alkanesulfonate monooxygenase SsuD/methylene tetrahydromethanopterin reductase-like flavin-dependent oxidoreductase (luciferase family)